MARRSSRKLFAFLLLALLSGAGLGVGWTYAHRSHSASLRLFAYETAFSSQTEAADFAASVTSVSALKPLESAIPAGLGVENFSQCAQVLVEPGAPFVTVAVVHSEAEVADTLVRLLAGHVASYGEHWVTNRTTEVDRQLTAVQARLRELRQQFGDFEEALRAADVRSLRETLARRQGEQAQALAELERQMTALRAEETRLAAAQSPGENPTLRHLQQELEQALTRFTEEHPRVKELRASIASLQKAALLPPASPTSSSNSVLAEVQARRTQLGEQILLASVAENRSRQALDKFATNEVEFVRLQSEYVALNARRDELIHTRVNVGSKGVEKWRQADRVEMARVWPLPLLVRSTLVGAGAGLAGAAICLALWRARRRVIRDSSILAQATDLPVLGVLPDLTRLDQSARDYWAVEMLQTLRHRAPADRRGLLVCGVISSGAGEGRSTLLELLADAGLRSGQKVSVFSRTGSQVLLEAPSRSAAVDSGEEAPAPAALAAPPATSLAALLAAESPESDRSSRRRSPGNSQPRVSPALVLVELPPADTAEALLLGGSVPNVIWLSAAHRAGTEKTVACVQTLRNTGCNLIGAILNLSPSRI